MSHKRVWEAFLEPTSYTSFRKIPEPRVLRLHMRLTSDPRRHVYVELNRREADMLASRVMAIVQRWEEKEQ